MKAVHFTTAFLVLTVNLPFAASLYAQQKKTDTAYIKQFDVPNVVELYAGAYSTHFSFTGVHEHKTKNDYRLVANSSAYLGTYVNYKWVSLKYSWAMPGTELDKNVRLKYTSLSLRMGTKQMAFHPFYDSYNGLLIPAKEPGNRYKPFRGIQFSDAGMDLSYYTQSNRFSYHAAAYFSEVQIKSKGTFFMMATPMWQKINWKNPSLDIITDTATFRLLSADPQWISLVARAGFMYNFVFQRGKWSIAPAILVGAGGLKELPVAHTALQAVTDIQAWITAGYNGPEFYFYANAWRDDLQTNLLIKNLQQVNTDFSITAGYRFPNLKKKILKLL